MTFLASILTLHSLLDGGIAQLVERLVRNEKVRGSIPLASTSLSFSIGPLGCDPEGRGVRGSIPLASTSLSSCYLIADI